MAKGKFIKKLEKGALLARRQDFANMYLCEVDKEKTEKELEEFAKKCVGSIAAPPDLILKMFHFAAESIKF